MGGSRFARERAMNISAEMEFIKTFVVKQKQERYAYLMQSPKRRGRFLRELFHFRDFDPAYEVLESGADDLLMELRKRGAPVNCLIVSVRPDLDGTRM
ncbi:MAG TPA: hypothetical protein VEP29_02100, partial [Desulfatiglandales bacterium]|nr:hypothetical protein [Desulfatiglandales bacterium]